MVQFDLENIKNNIQCSQNILKTSQNSGCNEFQPIVPPLSIWFPFVCHLDRTAMCEVDGIGPVPSGPHDGFDRP